MIKQIFVCDKCKNEWELHHKDTPTPITFEVKIDYDRHKVSNYPFNSTESFTRTWCSNCAIEFGIMPPVCKSESAPEVPLTTEEKLITLLKELGFNRVE
jgi:hypothetical protein